MTSVKGSGPAAGSVGASNKPAGRSTQPFVPRFNPDGSGGPGPKYLRTEVLLDRTGDTLANRFIINLAERILAIDQINAVCLRTGTPWPSSHEMIDHLFSELDIEWRVTNPEALKALDDTQAVFVANHPYGMPDAFALNNLLEDRGRPFRLFANAFLTCADSITHNLLFVDPFMNEKNRAMNRRSMMHALKHLKEGGDLALFPGRICSHLKRGSTTVQDEEWTDQVRIFVEAGKASLVPVHISGRNSWLFQLAGLIHPRLRTLLILREFKRGKHRIDFTIGTPVPCEKLLKAARFAAPGQIARALTYSANPAYRRAEPESASAPVRLKHKKVVASSAGSVRDTRTASIPANAQKVLQDFPILVEHGDLAVYDVTGGLPEKLTELVGRTRLDAFGAEAALGNWRDLIDEYDSIYSHLVLFDRQTERVAGTYRYLIPSRVEGGVDPRDLVIASIFELKKPFLDLLPSSLELGRAAIGSEFQKTYAPLMLMWRAVMEILRKDKTIKYLIGPVTTPRSFSPLSRTVLRRFIEQKCMHRSLANSARPLHPHEERIAPEIAVDDLVRGAQNLTGIGCIIEALEGGERKLPVLYKQYANLGLRYVATGEWPELDGAMASLAVLEVSQIKRDFVARYLEKDRVAEFFENR